MSAALDLNWDLIKTRYVAGASAAYLCKEYGINRNTLEHRIQDGQWRKLRAECNQDTHAAAQRVLRERSTALRETLSEVLVSDTKVLAKQKPKKNTLAQRANTMKALAQTGAVIFGWGDTKSSQRPVNIAILSQAPASLSPLRLSVTPNTAEVTHANTTPEAPLAPDVVKG